MHHQESLDLTKYKLLIYDLNMILIDSSLTEREKRQRCQFKNCITFLNRANKVDQIFCSQHQAKVARILDSELNKEYKYYKALVTKHRRKLKKKKKGSQKKQIQLGENYEERRYSEGT